MKCCLGILAYQEEARIGATLAGLRAQDLWASPEVEARLIVVVNGSTDRTAARAREALVDFPVPTEVLDIPQPGKANAWNRFVHEFSPADTEVLILIDADILLPQTEALRTMVETLARHPAAVASVDEPVKTPGRAASPALGLSRAASRLAGLGPPKLCGQLYAARAAALRRIYLPEPLLVEDGFIKAMLTTDAFTAPENPDRLVRALGIWHAFEAESTMGGWIRHEKRILIGTLCNLILFEASREWAARGLEAGPTLRAQVEADPDWFRKQIRLHLGPGGRHRRLGILLPVPWRQLRQLRGIGKLKAVPVALIRSLLTLVVMGAAARDLRRGLLRW